MGREATVLELEEVTQTLSHRLIGNQENKRRIMYYIPLNFILNSGHRACKVSFGPDEIREKGNICPVCKRKLTEGVFLRLQQMAGNSPLRVAATKMNANGLKWFVDDKHHKPSYIKSVPLLEVVAEAQGSSIASQKTRLLYNKLTNTLGSELNILLKKPLSDISEAGGDKIASAIKKVREGAIFIQPGFDGEYGIVKIWGEEKHTAKFSTHQHASQMALDL